MPDAYASAKTMEFIQDLLSNWIYAIVSVAEVNHCCNSKGSATVSPTKQDCSAQTEIATQSEQESQTESLSPSISERVNNCKLS
jgi:hypothetical protein